jgi:hypothetical protein
MTEAQKAKRALATKQWKKNNPTAVSLMGKRHQARNPEKAYARMMFATAVECGKLIRPTKCSQCNQECRPEGHHPDYSKPLEVIWLCRQCHFAAHGRAWKPV